MQFKIKKQLITYTLNAVHFMSKFCLLFLQNYMKNILIDVTNVIKI